MTMKGHCLAVVLAVVVALVAANHPRPAHGAAGGLTKE